MTITLNLDEDTAKLLTDILETALEVSPKISGPDSAETRALLSALHSASQTPAHSQQTLLQHYPEPLFGNGLVADEGNIISSYPRDEALEDGVLLDVTPMAREVGYDLPVAMTRGLSADIENIPSSHERTQDVEGRTWDVLYTGFLAMRALIAENKRLQAKKEGLKMETTFLLQLPLRGRITYEAKLVFTVEEGHKRPLITLMKPDED